MEIKDIEKNELELICVDLLTKVYSDLGQKDNDAENKVMLAQSLAKDLKFKYPTMPLKGVELAFYKGPRDTDLFVVSSGTWCKWLNKMKAEIWEGWHHFDLGNHHAIQNEINVAMQGNVSELKSRGIVLSKQKQLQ